MKYNTIKEDTSLPIKRVLCYIVLTLFSLLCLIFFYMLLVNSSRSHAEINQGFSFMFGSNFFRNFDNVVHNETTPIITGVINSLIVSSFVALLSIYVSALTAYAIHVYDFKGKRFLFNFILLIMTVPTQVTALGFIRLINDIGLRNNFLALILPAMASPVVFFFMKQYMDSSLPLEIVEAARIDGSNEFKTFNTIVLPIMKPAMAVQAIFTFTGAWNNYFTPALLLEKEKRTLPILIAQLRSADFIKFDMGQVYMMITIAIVPVMIVYFALSKFIVAGVTLGSVKG